MSGLLPVEEALRRVLALVAPLGTETVALSDARGRVLAEDAVARRDQPPFPASAMDGYAVRASEARAGAKLQVDGASAAGHGFHRPLPPSAAIQIFTGAPVPEGADAILIQENANRRCRDIVEVLEAPDPGQYIRPAGLDFKAGSTLSAPRRLGPRDAALLGAMDVSRPVVRRRPSVALIPTGDELVEPGETPGPDQIFSSNTYGIAALVEARGGVAWFCPIAKDSREGLEAALEAAHGADFIVTLGGASVGAHDIVAEVLGSHGLTLDFYRIAMRPGKPLMAGRLGDAVMLGLPGNPVSAIVCAELFLRPALDKALGLPAGPRARLTARWGAAVPANGPREHYMRARLEDGPEGPVVTPFDDQDSSRLALLSAADVLAIRPPHAPAAEPNETTDCILLT